jgi:hypothetical protein
MKKSFLAILLLVSSSVCFSQTSTSNAIEEIFVQDTSKVQKPKVSPVDVKAKAKMDSLDKANKIIVPADSIAIISAIDIVKFLDILKKSASYDVYTKLPPDQVLVELYKWAVVEWSNNKKKKVKK